MFSLLFEISRCQKRVTQKVFQITSLKRNKTDSKLMLPQSGLASRWSALSYRITWIFFLQPQRWNPDKKGKIYADVVNKLSGSLYTVPNFRREDKPDTWNDQQFSYDSFSDQSKSTTYHLGQIRWYFLYRRMLPSNTHNKLCIKYFEGNIIHRSFAVSFFYWELAQNRLKWCSPNTEKKQFNTKGPERIFWR